MEFSDRTVFAIIASMVIVFGVGVALVEMHPNVLAGPKGPVNIELEVTDRYYNSTLGYQPSYFVVGNGKLTSSATINVPDYTVINLTIIDKGKGYNPIMPQFLNVTGTINGKMILRNITGNTTVVVSHVNELGHSFTIMKGSSVVVNLPVVPMHITNAKFILHSGVFTWQCEAECGGHGNPMGPPMGVTSWMDGTVISE